MDKREWELVCERLRSDVEAGFKEAIWICAGSSSMKKQVKKYYRY